MHATHIVGTPVVLEAYLCGKHNRIGNVMVDAVDLDANCFWVLLAHLQKQATRAGRLNLVLPYMEGDTDAERRAAALELEPAHLQKQATRAGRLNKVLLYMEGDTEAERRAVALELEPADLLTQATWAARLNLVLPYMEGDTDAERRAVALPLNFSTAS